MRTQLIFRVIMVVCGVWGTMALSASAGQVSRDNLVTYMGFESTMQARPGRSAILQTPDVEVQYGPGVRGDCVATSDMLTYRLRCDETNEGTVCFWVRPVDWAPGDGKVHVFWKLSDSTNWSALMTVGFGMTQFYQATHDPHDNRAHSIQMYKCPLEQGQWMHFAMTWRYNDIQVYVNGVHLYACEQPYLAPVMDAQTTMQIGGKGVSVDELYLFNRYLDAHNMRSLYVGRLRQPGDILQKHNETSTPGESRSAAWQPWYAVEDYVNCHSSATAEVHRQCRSESQAPAWQPWYAVEDYVNCHSSTTADVHRPCRSESPMPGKALVRVRLLMAPLRGFPSRLRSRLGLLDTPR